MPASRVKIDERIALIIKGAVFEGYNLCHLARESDQVQPLEDGEFANALIQLGKKPDSFIREIREKYDPLFRGKKTSSGSGSGRSSNDPALAEVPYDPSLCSKRVWNGGLGAQCQSAKVDGCEFCNRCTKEFGNKGALPFGYYDQEKPEFDLVTNKSLPWKKPGESIETKQPTMKVSEIREMLEERGLDSSGKKKEIKERLDAALKAEEQEDQGDQEEMILESPKPVKPVKKKSSTPKKVYKKKKVEVQPESTEPNIQQVEEEPIAAPARITEKISFANGKSINMDLGPVDNGEGVGLKLVSSDEEETQDIDGPIPEEAQEEAQEEEDVEEDEEAQEDEDEEEQELDTDDFIEIEFEDHDYLIDEDSSKVYTTEGLHIGSWDEEDGIIWLDTKEALVIKAQNGHE